jgi:hypothetical protein
MFDMNKKEKVVCFLKKCIVPFSFAVLSLFGCLLKKEEKPKILLF